MCGRFALTIPLDAVVKKFFIDDVYFDYAPDSDISPGKIIPVIIPADGKRIIRGSIWGFIPSWAKDKMRPVINARSESVHEKPSFKTAFKQRRCLIPATGFYEWKEGDGKKKIRYLIKSGERDLFAFAGICEKWKLPDGGEELRSAIITTEADESIRHIHHRMPVIIRVDMEDIWLDPSASGEAADILAGYISEKLTSGEFKE